MSNPHIVPENKQPIVFLVMDSRARTNIDDASCIECIDEYINYERVWKQFKKEYKGYDYCLVPFIAEGNKLVKHPKISMIESLNDLSLL